MAGDQAMDEAEPGSVVTGRRVVRFEKQAIGGEALALAAATRLNGGPGSEPAPGADGGGPEDGVTVTAEAASATDLVVEGTAVVHDGDRATARLRLVEAMNRAVARAAAVESPLDEPGPEHDEAAGSDDGEAERRAEPETAEEAERRAERLFADLPTGPDRVDELHLAVDCIDLTTLEGDDTRGRVRALCAQAVRPDPTDPDVGPVAAVCVYPQLARLASELTAGTGVAVASVAGAFPSGLSAPEVKLADIEAALAAGATEIDIVLDRSAFLDGRRADARADIVRARRATTKAGAHLKVILEVGELVEPAVITAAARLAMEAGADFIKTSTGKSKTSATPGTVLVMAEAVAAYTAQTERPVGIKVAGGVRTADQALGYLAIVHSVLGPAWLTPERFRFGASGLLGGLLAELAASP